jgi:hypothetical protein
MEEAIAELNAALFCTVMLLSFASAETDAVAAVALWAGAHAAGETLISLMAQTAHAPRSALIITPSHAS